MYGCARNSLVCLLRLLFRLPSGTSRACFRSCCWRGRAGLWWRLSTTKQRHFCAQHSVSNEARHAEASEENTYRHRVSGLFRALSCNLQNFYNTIARPSSGLNTSILTACGRFYRAKGGGILIQHASTQAMCAGSSGRTNSCEARAPGGSLSSCRLTIPFSGRLESMYVAAPPSISQWIGNGLVGRYSCCALMVLATSTASGAGAWTRGELNTSRPAALHSNCHEAGAGTKRVRRRPTTAVAKRMQ